MSMFESDVEQDESTAPGWTEQKIRDIEANTNDNDRQFLRIVDENGGRARTSDLTRKMVKQGQFSKAQVTYSFRKLSGEKSALDTPAIEVEYVESDTPGSSDERVAVLTPAGEEAIARGLLDGDLDDLKPSDPLEALKARVDEQAETIKEQGDQIDRLLAASYVLLKDYAGQPDTPSEAELEGRINDAYQQRRDVDTGSDELEK